MSKASLELGGGNWAAKDRKLLGYAVGDTSGKYVPREFDFTRNSDIAATRVNEDGLIEKYRENLLLHSNQFDTTWDNLLDSTITGGQSGYDGSNDAWLLEKGATTYRRIEQTISLSGVWTMSAYLKAGTASISRFRFGSASYMVEFNLSSGVATDKGSVSAIDYGMTKVGNGWYRCYATFNASVSMAQIYVDWADSSASNMYIQDAQLEYGLVATDYLESGAATGKAGILDNLPRIDYTGGSASLLLEPQRVNLVTDSEYFGSSAWSTYTFGGASLTKSFGYTSPEGVDNAYKFDIIIGTGGILLTQDLNVTASVDYTLSVWLKGDVGGEKIKIDLRNSTSSGISGAEFTLTTEWKRYDVSVTNDSGTSRGFQFRCTTTNTTSDQTIYVYGAQLEEGSYPTSYIPTYGASVTRNNEYATSPSDTFDSISSFTWFFEISRLGFDTASSNTALTLRTSAGVEQIRCHFDAPAQQIRIRDAINGYANVGNPISVTANTYVKVCVVSDGNTIKTFANGTQSGSSYTIVTQHDIDRVYMNQAGFSCRQLLVFPTALTDSECIALTTL